MNGAMQDMLNVRSLARALVTLLPLFITYAATGDTHWLSASIVTISLVIAIERVGLATAGAFLQGSVILAVFVLLSLALPRPPVFAVGCAIVGAFAVVMTAWGERLRTVGNFIFIPGLYLTCEAAEARVAARELLPYLAGGMVPPLILTMVDLGLRSHPSMRQFGAELTRLHGERPLGGGVPLRQILEASVAVVLAVGSMACVVEWWHWHNGQWAIWSAASVVTGDAAGACRS